MLPRATATVFVADYRLTTKCDVDQADFDAFQACLSGSFVPQTEPTCASALPEEDNDVDQGEWARFMACFTGPSDPANYRCAE